LRQDNRAAWGEIWRGRILLHGAEPRWQDALDSAYYYLHASAHESMPCSVGPFGMSPGYSAHKFWDTETFMFPPILLTAPASARAMLDYRTRMLPSARAAAAMSGYAGIQFPWQSGNSGGEVTTLPWSPAAINQQHINTDVAFAFCQYVAATGDREFERNQAWPVVGGVAEWLASRVSRTARGYEIRHIVGADERIENVHNNGYTNMCAVVILREAVAMATRLGLFAPGAWSEIADHLYIPVDPEGGFIRKHDAYVHNPEHMCIPDTLMGLYPFPYRHSPSVDDATIRYHLGLLDRFWGMPMWASSLGVFAARLGDRALAARLFERGVLEYIAQPYHAYCEFSPGLPPVATGEMKMHSPFLTNAAGFVMACLFGLPGIVVDSGDPKAWPRHPVVLPSGWDTIEVERIWVRGKPARLLARQGTSRAQIEWTA
jgi:hypothetical protein